MKQTILGVLLKLEADARIRGFQIDNNFHGLRQQLKDSSK